MKAGKIKIDLFNAEIIFAVSDKIEDCFKKFKIPSDGIPFNDSDGMFIVYEYKGFQYGYIFLCNDADESVAVHESLHATNWVLKSRNVKPCFENDETQAYLLQSIFTQIKKIQNKK